MNADKVDDEFSLKARLDAALGSGWQSGDIKLINQTIQ
jgi:hypothetical protein